MEKRFTYREKLLCLILITTQEGKTLLLFVSFAHSGFYDTNPVSSQRFQTKNPSQPLKAYQFSTSRISSSKPASSSSVTSLLLVGSPTFDWLGQAHTSMAAHHLENLILQCHRNSQKICHCWVLCRI